MKPDTSYISLKKALPKLDFFMQPKDIKPLTLSPKPFIPQYSAGLVYLAR